MYLGLCWVLWEINTVTSNPSFKHGYVITALPSILFSGHRSTSRKLYRMGLSVLIGSQANLGSNPASAHCSLCGTGQCI